MLSVFIFKGDFSDNAYNSFFLDVAERATGTNISLYQNFPPYLMASVKSYFVICRGLYSIAKTRARSHYVSSLAE